MPKSNILVVDDEKDIVNIVKYNLKKEGFSVKGVYSGGAALDIIDKDAFDLIILDIMLPGIDGYEICKKLKEKDSTRNIPVIMLTVKAEESDIVKGLRCGADDYVTKPFSPQILIERVRTVLRRALGAGQKKQGGIISYAGIQLDTSKYTVQVDNSYPEELAFIEFNILKLFLENPGHVFSRDDIISNSWNDKSSGQKRAVDVHITWLRQKLGDKSSLIETVRGVGYRFKESA